MKRLHASVILAAVPAAALLLASGCATFNDQAEATEQHEDMLIVQEDMQKLSGRLEGVELEVQRLRADMDRLRAQSGASAEVQSLQARVDDLSNKIRSVDAARQRDKQEIVDKLSAKVTQIVTSSGSSVKKGTPKKNGSDVGYEHMVQPGESLSAIAAAYGVTVKAIMDNNDIKDPKTLRAGQKLFIPK